MPRCYVDRAWVATATTGTGTVTLGAAQAGYFTFAEAGLQASCRVTYTIQDGNNFEIGIGTYTAGGPTLSRDVVIASKISGTAGTSRINLSGTATVFVTISALELEYFGHGMNEVSRIGAFTL
jgi:hypothetical protein